MIPFAATSDLTTRITSIRGWHLTSAGAATVNLRNGSASGDIYVPINLAAAGESHFAAGTPLLFPKGVYVQVATGTVVGSIQPG